MENANPVLIGTSADVPGYTLCEDSDSLIWELSDESRHWPVVNFSAPHLNEVAPYIVRNGPKIDRIRILTDPGSTADCRFVGALRAARYDVVSIAPVDIVKEAVASLVVTFPGWDWPGKVKRWADGRDMPIARKQWKIRHAADAFAYLAELVAIARRDPSAVRKESSPPTPIESPTPDPDPPPPDPDDLARCPAGGYQFYLWMRRIQDATHLGLLNHIGKFAQDAGHAWKTNEWPDSFFPVAYLEACRILRLNGVDPDNHRLIPVPGGSDPIQARRHTLQTLVLATIKVRKGAYPTDIDIIDEFGELAALHPTGATCHPLCNCSNVELLDWAIDLAQSRADLAGVPDDVATLGF